MNEKELSRVAKWMLTIFPAMGWAVSFLNIMGETKSGPEPFAFLVFIICSVGLIISFEINVLNKKNKDEKNAEDSENNP